MAVPVGKWTNQITKAYVGVLNNELKDLSADRYFYPLVVLSEFETPPTQQQLADVLDTGKALMVRIVDYLSDRGLVTRTPGAEDRRCHLIQLTPEGEKRVPTVKKAIEKTNNICFRGFSRAERNQAEDLLMKITNNLHSEPREAYDIELSKAADHEK